jgi:hypothetical protein
MDRFIEFLYDLQGYRLYRPHIAHILSLTPILHLFLHFAHFRRTMRRFSPCRSGAGVVKSAL